MPSLELSAEDRIVVVDLATRDLAPDPSLVGRLTQTALELDDWELVWDLRGIRGVFYADSLSAYAEAAAYQATAPMVLATPGDEEAIEAALTSTIAGKIANAKILATRDKPLVKRPLELSPFSEDWIGDAVGAITPADMSEVYVKVDEKVANDLLRGDGSTAVELGIVEDQEEAAELVDQLLEDTMTLDRAEIRVDGEVQAERARLLSTFLDQIASNSLLAQLAFVHDAGRISVVPMHGSGLHDLDCGEALLAIRPARRGAATQWQRFASAIEELEELVNTPGVKEAEIESLLVRYPQFLRGLNYTETYHQVILPLGDQRSLRPDVIAEPAAEGWCDVIDLKLPTEPVFVGPGDRPRLSHAIAEAAAQLRQYAKWFDDRKVAEVVEERYGFRCYRPRQVVMIGRDPRSSPRRSATPPAVPIQIWKLSPMTSW